MRSVTCALAIAAVLSAWPAGAAIKGHWVNPSKSVVLNIAPCGKVLCGTVTWASEKAKRDSLKGTNQLVGSHLLTHLKAQSHDSWKGTIFVPDQNMHASAKLKLVKP